MTEVTELTERSELVLPTRVCHAGWDEHEYCGYRLFQDFAGKETLTGMFGMAVTGRRLSPLLRGFLDDLATVVGPPDPRIWPPKTTRLASAYGRAIPGIAVGALVFESGDVGPMTCSDSADFFCALSEVVGDRLDDFDALERATLDAASRLKRVAGFGVHFRPVDERLVVLRTLIERRGLHTGRFWRLFEGVASVLKKAKGIEPNYGSAIAAVLLDLGVAPKKIGILVFAIVQHVQLANAVEGADQAPEILRRLPDECITYAGAPPRVSPRAARADEGRVPSSVTP